MSDVSETIRRGVYERDGHRCVVSTPECGGGLTLQHRVSRGMGGSHLLDGYENLIAMCLDHNVRLETDAAFAALGRRLGWKLEAGENPLMVAVFSTVWGGWRVLDAVGESVPVTARDEDQRLALRVDRYAGWRN